MKVYVDELPTRCIGCCLLSDGNFCNHDDFVGELHSINIYKEKPKNCPLKLLDDYTKQVRKEVVQEIRKFYTTPIYDRENAHTEVGVLLSRLDQIEQGENNV